MDGIKKIDTYGPVTREGLFYGRCVMTVRYSQEGNYVVFSVATVGEHDIPLLVLCTYRFHGQGLRSAKIETTETGETRVLVTYRLPINGREEKYRLPIVGRSERTLLRNAAGIVRLLNTLMDNSPSEEEIEKGNAMRQSFQKKHGLDPYGFSELSLSALYAKYGDETLPYLIHNDHFVFLPSELGNLFHEGSMATRTEMKLLNKLIVPTSSILFVLYFESVEKYGNFRMELPNRTGDRFINHDFPVRNQGVPIAVIFMDSSCPIQSFAVGIEKVGMMSMLLGQSNLLLPLIQDKSYESFLRANNVVPGDERLVPLFLGHQPPK